MGVRPAVPAEGESGIERPYIAFSLPRYPRIRSSEAHADAHIDKQDGLPRLIRCKVQVCFSPGFEESSKRP